ncbi:DUF4275 family protein [Bacillus sp. FJAT-27445]|uniref:DUF4275 family protein n=1 Tax=Bacillus sp. FJAT-27445 TaxID=1679166 RepID=UPI000ADD7CC6|nr:DUF4275 family protein [Bacillus sp. FJAT-27445]
MDILKNKNFKVKEMPKGGVFLRKEWENNFATHLSDKDKRSIYLYDNEGYSGYLWHLFSFKKKDCLEGGEAEKAFQNVPKSECFIFFQNSDHAFLLEDASMLHIDDLSDETGLDVYIVDKEFHWTFVRTHETGWCGPFFCRK